MHPYPWLRHDSLPQSHLTAMRVSEQVNFGWSEWKWKPGRQMTLKRRYFNIYRQVILSLWGFDEIPNFGISLRHLYLEEEDIENNHIFATK
ncbi:hypothetical protein TNCV_3654381 [Trichonephila clavipes]|nr:hypothetical protein TNCV_3654381 [Trichonephila clavipes]